MFPKCILLALVLLFSSASQTLALTQVFIPNYETGICPAGVACGTTIVSNLTVHTRTTTEKSVVTITDIIIPPTVITTAVTEIITIPVTFNDCTLTETSTINDDLTIVETDTIHENSTIHAVITTTDFVTLTTNITKHCVNTAPPIDPSPPTKPVTSICNLASPTALAGTIAASGVVDDIDDETYNIQLDFPISLFGATYTMLAISTNGVVSGTSVNPPIRQSTSGRNGPIPDSSFPSVSAFIFWDDLAINKGTKQGIFYELSGAPGARSIKVEYVMGKFGVPHEKYHFQWSYSQTQPGRVVYKYFEVSDSGRSATIGIQGPSRQTLRYSLNEAKITSNTEISLNTETGAIDVSKF